MKAYSYIRFSSAKQAQGDSLRRQTELASRYAQRNSLELDESLTYRDLGVSAFDRSNVETGALAAFLAAVNSGKVPPGSILLVEQLDRLTRADVYTAFSLLSTILDAGITLVTLEPEHIYRSGTADLGSLMMALVSLHRGHEESKVKSDRVGSAWLEKRERREAVLTKECPRWLVARDDRTGYDVLADRAESVRRVYELTVAGYGNVAIIRRANAERWPAPSTSGTWHTSLVGRLLNSRAVLGEYHPSAKPRDSEGRIAPRSKPQPTGEVWAEHYPRIISDELFQLAQAARQNKSKMPARRDALYKNIFQGVLKCGACGASFIRKNKDSAKQKGYAIYMCANRVRGVTDCPSENAANLEERFLMLIYANAYEHISSQDELMQLQDNITLLRQRLADAQASVVRLVDAIEQTDSPGLVARLVTAEKLAKGTAQELAEAESHLLTYQLSLTDKSHLMTRTLVDDLARLRDDSEVEFRAQLREKLIRLIENAYAFPEYHAIIVKYRHSAVLAYAPLHARYHRYNMPMLVEHLKACNRLAIEAVEPAIVAETAE